MVKRLTIPTRLVLEAMLVDDKTEVYGLELARAAGLPSGTVHPILARLEGLGWVTSRWEDVDPVEAGRPPRRYYRLTSLGGRSRGRVWPGRCGPASPSRGRPVLP